MEQHLEHRTGSRGKPALFSTTSPFVVVALVLLVALPAMAAANCELEQEWMDPCGNRGPRNTRHSRSPRDATWRQFKLSVGSMGYICSLIPEKFPNLNVACGKQKGGFRWLQPSRTRSDMGKEGDVKKLEIFARDIQLYAATIYKLSKMEIHSQGNAFLEEPRCELLRNLSHNMGLLQCEVEAQLDEKNIEPKHIPYSSMDRRITLPSSADITIAGAQYSGVVTKLKQFLKVGQKALYGKSKKGKNKKSNAQLKKQNSVKRKSAKNAIRNKSKQ